MKTNTNKTFGKFSSFLPPSNILILFLICVAFCCKLSAQSRQIPDGQALQQCDELIVSNYIFDTILQTQLDRTYVCQRSAPAPGQPNATYTYAFACYGNGEILNLSSTFFTTSTHQNYSYKWVIKTFELLDTGWTFYPFMEIIQFVGTGKDTSINVDTNNPIMYQGNYSVTLEQYSDNTFSTLVATSCPIDFFIQGNAKPLNITVEKRGCQTCVELNGTFSPINKCTNSWTGANQRVYLDWGDNTSFDYVWGNARQDGGSADNPNPKRFCKLLQPGIYNIKLIEQIDGEDCEIERKDSVFFTVYPNPVYSVTSPSNTYCSNSSQPLVLTANIQSQNPNSIFTYQWSTGETTFSINVTPTSTTTYYVNMFDQDTTCIWTDSIKINVLQNCCFGDTHNGVDLTFSNTKLSTIVTNYPQLFNVVAGQPTEFIAALQNTSIPIAFNGLIEADIDFKFNRNTIFFSTDAIFRISQGVDVELHDYTTFDVCGTSVWQGIEIDGTLSNGQNSSIVVNDHSRIRNAQIAINAQNDAGITMFGGVSLQNNYIGLMLQNYDNTPNVVDISNLISCTQGGLLNPYLGKTAHAGILLLNADNITIQNTSFNGLNIGVEALISDNLSIAEGAYFSNIRNFEQSSNSNYGTAIVASSLYDLVTKYNVNINTEIPSAPNAYRFQNCDRGISLWNYEATIENNKMFNVEKGIEAQQLKNGKFLNINNNEFTGARYGIHLSSFNGTSFVVESNTFNLPTADNFTYATFNGFIPSTPYGVLAENMMDIYNVGIINANTIENGRYPIWLRTNQMPTEVSFNNISFTQNFEGANIPACSGIRVHDGRTFFIRENQIFGASSTTQVGIRNNGVQLVGSRDYHLNCNNFGNLLIGLDVNGNCEPRDFVESIRENRFGDQNTDMGYGIKLSRVVGDYGFIGTDVGSDIHALNNNFEATNYLLGYHTYNQTNSGGQNWWTTFWDHPSNDILYSPTLNGSNLPNNDLANQLKPALSGASWESGTCETLTNTERVAGYTEEELDKLKEIANDEVNYPAFQDGSRWLNEKELYKKLDKDTTLRLSKDELEDFYDDKKINDLGAIKEAEDKANELAAQPLSDLALYIQKLTEWEDKIDDIPTPNIYADKAKQMLKLDHKLSTIEPNDIASADRNTINFLSEQCPYLYGSGVYKARVLRGLYEDGIDYDDKVICQLQGMFKKEGESATDDDLIVEKKEGDFQLITNPVKHQLRFRYSLPENSTANLFVYDNMGRLVTNSQLKHNTALSTLSVVNLASGIYHIRFEGSNGYNHSEHFVKN